MTSSAVEFIPMSVPVPVLSATQIESVMTKIQPLLKDKSLEQILVNMPVIVEECYGLVQSFAVSNQQDISSVVVIVISSALVLLPLPQADIVILNAIVGNLLPSIVSLVVKYIPELEEEVESCWSGCWNRLRIHFSYC